MKIKILCVSDTHGRFPTNLPDADILIHAGDATVAGTANQLKDFNDWLRVRPIAHKIFIPGNHDLSFEDKPEAAKAFITCAKVLIHESTTVMGLKFFGSPWTPWFNDWAFNYRRPQAEGLWSQIPEDTDILVTHGPPQGILDRTRDTNSGPGSYVGCPVLLTHVLRRIQPRLHVFGHIHEHGGKCQKDGQTLFVNAAVLDPGYRMWDTNHQLITLEVPDAPDPAAP